MGLKYQHGTDFLNLGESSISETITPILDSRGYRIRNKVRLDVTGRLRAATYSALQTRIDELKAMLENDNVDSGLVDASDNPGSHFITSSSTLYGTRVVDKKFPESSGAENTTWRGFSFAVEAEIASVDSSSDGLMFFFESVSLLGDGSSDEVLVESIDAVPEEQTLVDFTIVRAVQEGRALGNIAYPNFPSQLFGSGFRGKRSRREKGSPERIGTSLRNYPISWSYFYEFSSDPGLPNPNIG
jgi:hypothetical protein